jgi:hypothetical protein
VLTQERYCNEGYPHCLSLQEYLEIEEAIAKAERLTPCEKNLDSCQEELHNIPEQVVTVVETQVVYEIPDWAIAVLSILAVGILIETTYIVVDKIRR